jgi:hypothetical protein
MAASSEALLIAAVIRQAVEDFALSAEAVSHLKRETDRKVDRVEELIEDGRLAAEFLTPTSLAKFLADYGVEDLFHADTILRGVQKLYGITFPVAEHAVRPRETAFSFDNDSPLRALNISKNKFSGWTV